MSNRTNQVRIAGRRLRWDNGYSNLSGERSWALEREDGRALYFVKKVRGRKAGRRGSFEVTVASTKRLLGRKRTIVEAKSLAEGHFANRHGGTIEGHWTSYRKTYRLRQELDQKVQGTPKTTRYPRMVPEACPYCGSKRVRIENPPRTMGFNPQRMVCLHCNETVYKHRSYCRTDAERAYCGLTGSPVH